MRWKQNHSFVYFFLKNVYDTPAIECQNTDENDAILDSKSIEKNNDTYESPVWSDSEDATWGDKEDFLGKQTTSKFPSQGKESDDLNVYEIPINEAINKDNFESEVHNQTFTKMIFISMIKDEEKSTFHLFNEEKPQTHLEEIIPSSLCENIYDTPQNEENSQICSLGSKDEDALWQDQPER